MEAAALFARQLDKRIPGGWLWPQVAGAMMGDIERIIIDAKGDLLLQVKAAHAAITAGIEEGCLFGMGTEGKFFGVKRNKTSIRVYPQEPR